MSNKSAEMRTVAKRQAKPFQLARAKPKAVRRKQIGIRVLAGAGLKEPMAYLVYEVEMSDGTTKVGFGKPIGVMHGQSPGANNETLRLIMMTAANLTAYLEVLCHKSDLLDEEHSRGNYAK